MPMRIKTRRPDPPRQAQVAALRAASRRESARTEIERKLAKLGEIEGLAKSMVAPPVLLPTVPRPPGPPPPPPRRLEWDERRRQWYVPTQLTLEQLRSTEPTPEAATPPRR
jgi:hypothetical protein